MGTAQETLSKVEWARLLMQCQEVYVMSQELRWQARITLQQRALSLWAGVVYRENIGLTQWETLRHRLFTAFD